jgi:hypothetical protein
MNWIRACTLLGALSAAAILAGCQSAAAPATEPAATQASGMITPDGDRLDGPIPYPHWPFDIATGGGGGATGR